MEPNLHFSCDRFLSNVICCPRKGAVRVIYQNNEFQITAISTIFSTILGHAQEIEIQNQITRLQFNIALLANYHVDAQTLDPQWPDKDRLPLTLGEFESLIEKAIAYTRAYEDVESNYETPSSGEELRDVVIRKVSYKVYEIKI